MNRTSPRRAWHLWPVAVVALLLLGIGLFIWLRKGAENPKSDPLAATEANARGVGLMERFDYPAAANEFEEAARFAPDWLPARINLGMALYNSASKAEDPVLPRAIEIFERVLREEPDNPYAHFNLGIIFKYQAKYAEAKNHFQKVIDADPEDDRAWLYLAQSNPNFSSEEEPKRQFQKALGLNPYLVPAWYALAFHLTTSEADRAAMIDRMEQLRISNWEDEARADRHSEQGRYATVIGRGLAKVADVGPMPLFHQATTWKIDPGVKWDGGDRDRPLAVDGLLRALRARYGHAMIRLDFDGDGKPDLLLLSAAFRHGKLCDVLLRNDGAGFVDISETAGLDDFGSLACAVGDYDNDGRPDLALSTPNGLRLLRNVDGKRFEDKSAEAGFDTITGLFFSLCWFDLDQDGDLDLVAGRYSDRGLEETQKPGFAGLEQIGGAGKLMVMRNVGVAAPGKFNEVPPPLTTAFKPLELPDLNIEGRVTGIVATDIDGDKDIDLIVLLEGRGPVVVLNDRLMRFSAGGALPTDAKTLHSGLVFDSNGDEQSDLFLLGAGKPTFLVSKKEVADGDFARRFGAGVTDAPSLFSAQRCDLDLDGRSDLVGLSGTKAVFLQGDGEGKLTNRSEPFGPAIDKLPLNAIAVADIDGDGAPDLIAWSTSGPQIFLGIDNGNRGLKLLLNGVPREPVVTIGQKNLRTNTDGIGTKCRTLTGSLRSMVELTTLSSGPGQSLLPIDIGIGRRTQADTVRIRWPDCVVQAELAVPAGAIVAILEVNRKPVSCPVLMTWDGEKWIYVTDFLGAGSMGESGSDGTTRPPRPEESVKIESHQLGLKNGKYVLRIAEPMDEVMYLDHLRLTVVDHPADTAVFPDERFAIADPQPTQKVLAFRKRVAPVRAVDHKGTDQTKTILDRDGKTVSGFAFRSWLGFAEEHWIEFEFGDRLKDFAKGADLHMVLAGWIDYAFPESIYAAEQAGVVMLPPVFEHQRRDGTWEKLADIGFPAGLPRVMTVPVGKWIDRESNGKYRIRTNLQIHWDQLFIGAAEELSTSRELPPSRVSLSHPGYVQEISTGGRPPLGYDPNRFESVAVTDWKGRLTKLGYVGELLAKVDDRFAICGPGDELLAEFDAVGLPPLKAGWTRSFVLRTHGYCKDSTPTTQTGGDVNPLPFRGMTSYPTREPGPKTEAEDLRLWHTRPAGGNPSPIK